MTEDYPKERITFKDWSVVIFLLLLGAGISYGLFYWGCIHERKEWHKTVPQQMDVLCEQCQQNGLFMGFKKGNEKGLSTCSDVLSKLDEEGR